MNNKIVLVYIPILRTPIDAGFRLIYENDKFLEQSDVVYTMIGVYDYLPEAQYVLTFNSSLYFISINKIDVMIKEICYN